MEVIPKLCLILSTPLLDLILSKIKYNEVLFLNLEFIQTLVL